jgi:hypothetical protein
LATKKQFTWTETRREIADLAAQGKEFMEIIALGYSKDTTSKVLRKLRRDQKAKELADGGNPGAGGNEDGNGHGESDEKDGEKEGKEGQLPGRSKPLVAATSPRTAPIIFRLGQKEIVLDPLELHAQYRYYLDLARRDGGITESFSEVLTLGIQVLWALHQEVPMTPNMLKAIFTGYK